MNPFHPISSRPRPAPAPPTLHSIYRAPPNTDAAQPWAPSPVDSLEPPPGVLTAVGSSSSSYRPSSHHKSSTDTGFQRSRPKIAVIFADILGIVIPFGFIAFAIVVIKIDGTRTDPSAPFGTRTNSLGPYKDPINIFATAFPIFFAALVGRLITMFIRWKLERGARLQFLERLLGSRSVGNTVLTMFLMPLSWFTLLLLLVWTFSPLGAQSILRILETQMHDVNSTASASYFDTDTTSWLASPQMIRSGLDGTPMGRLAFISSMYSASLLSSNAVKTSSSDIWGNLKIPFVQSYTTNKDWQIAQPNDPLTLLSSSSLVGLPLVNVPFGNSTFNIESSYVYLDYESSEMEEYDNLSRNATSTNSARLGMHAGSWSMDPPNGTWQGRNHFNVPETASASWNLALDNFISPRWDPRSNPSLNFRPKANDTTPYSPQYFVNLPGIETNQTRLKLEVELPLGTTNDKERIFKAYFRVTQHYIESRVSCSRLTTTPAGTEDRPFCSVVQNRPSTKPHAPADITPLSFPLLFTFVTDRLPRAGGIPCHFYSRPGLGLDPSIAYLVSPLIKAILPQPNIDGGVSGEVDRIADEMFKVTTLPPEVLAVRLSQLLNTYLLLGQSYEVATAATDPGASLDDRGVNVTVEVTNLEERYHVVVEWMALYIAASVVLLAGGILATVLAHTAMGPEVLGFASSILRDSKFVEIEQEHRRLDGVDLTNKLAQKRIRFGFVEGTTGEEGRPLLGVAAEEDVRELRK